MVILLLALSSAHAQARIKDLVSVEGVRGNVLVGYGLVMGLDGTGDRLNNIAFTEESLESYLDRLGVAFPEEDLRTRNVASVFITATLPSFARSGSRIDVNVSSAGDARSLLGGQLLPSVLLGPDQQPYAIAQGSIVAGGFTAEGDAAQVTTGVPTAGRIPNGAIVEREMNFALDELSTLQLSLRTPDATTAVRIADAINARIGGGVATSLDVGTVEVRIPQRFRRAGGVTSFLAAVENIEVVPDGTARVVIEESTGTIVIGSNVRVSTVAVAQGNITIEVTETPVVSQPGPFAQQGQTVVVPRTGVEVDEGEEGRFQIIGEGVTLQELVNGLNALGVGPRDMISILTAVKSAGALHAELVVQ
jgi:flagellar P-ring protein precursor FlgI